MRVGHRSPLWKWDLIQPRQTQFLQRAALLVKAKSKGRASKRKVFLDIEIS
jgi:hypothetical protein